MSGFLKKTRPWEKSLGIMARASRFWIAQGMVVTISIAHVLLEGAELLRNSPLEFLPISFYWVPVMYAALRFGLVGSIITSALIILTSLPNWLFMESSENLWSELAIIVTAVVISILMGLEVDKKLEAQSNAKTYAANAVRSQEEERRRLSLDLHDDSIQRLVSVCHEIDALKDTSSSTQQSLLDIRSTVSGTAKKLRDLSVALRPPILDDMGVVSAIRSLLRESAAKAGFKEELNIEGKPRRLPADTELGLFRIAQEALHNIERHAKATRVHVGITFGANEIVLEVIDDGVGFGVSALQNRTSENHIGLLSMRERAEMMGGRLSLDSGYGKGTTVKAFIPILQDKNGNYTPRNLAS